jgi:hypothetical protein
MDALCDRATARRNLAAASALLSGCNLVGAIGAKGKNSAVSNSSEQFSHPVDAGLAKKPKHVARLIRAAQELAPAIEAVRQAIERQRALPAGLVDAMGAAGMFSLWLPTSLGGPELNAVDYVRVIEELSRVDGSVG